MNATKPAGPFFKWVGSKRKTAARIVDLFPHPDDVKLYVEPFLGSGAVFFEARARGYHAPAELADSSQDLVQAWQAVRAWNPKFLQALSAYEEQHSPAFYARVRKEKPQTRDRIGARFLYLNKAGFNGLWRVNSKGEFNVPIGDKFNGFDLDALKASAAAMGQADIACADYKASLDWLLFEHRNARMVDALVYLDPPYPPSTQTASFTRYTKADFGFDEHEQLADLFAKLAKRKVHVVLSNADMPFIRKLYKDYNITEIESHRSVSAKASTRGKAAELIIRSWS